VKRLAVTLLLLAACALGWAAEAVPMAEDPVLEQRLVAISEELRCLVCQNESLAGSRSELAQDLRRELRALIRQGRSDAQIKEFMVSRYGEFVLYRPPVKPSTWLLWMGPFVLMAAAVGSLLNYVRRRGLAAGDDEPPAPEEGARPLALKKGVDS
jgi:cytochrome c-type biogenesis protein CcmH